MSVCCNTVAAHDNLADLYYVCAAVSTCYDNCILTNLFKLPGVITGASGHATKSILTSANRQHIPEIWLSTIWPLPEHHQSQCPLCARRRHVHVCHWLCMQCVPFSVTCLLACYVTCTNHRLPNSAEYACTLAKASPKFPRVQLTCLVVLPVIHLWQVME